MSQAKLPTACPSCSHLLSVRVLECPECRTAVQGDFGLPVLARLSAEEQDFVVEFVRASGSLKDMARQYGVSYPTMRNRLDALIERVERIRREERKESEGSSDGASVGSGGN